MNPRDLIRIARQLASGAVSVKTGADHARQNYAEP